MKTAFFGLNNKHEIDIVIEQCKKIGIDVVKALDEPLSQTELSEIKEIQILSVFLDKVDRATIEALPNLKFINTRATGIDHIDIDCAKEKGIPVSNVPVYGSETVAEYAMGLILMLSRKLHITFVQSLLGIFERKKIRGNDLAGKTLGVLGTGNIGCKLVKMAHAFDMKILCYDIKENENVKSKCNATYVTLEELLKQSDVISIHLPYTKETHHLINKDTLKLLKHGVLLVNTARGPIVDITTVRKGLKDEIFGGVALDTFEGEQVWIKEEEMLDQKKLPSAEKLKKALEAFYLLKFKNVILTPHNAFNSHEALERMLNTSLQDITLFNKTGDCQNRVA